MVKHSPHTRWKGCCMLCAAGTGWNGWGKHKGAGAARYPFKVLRQLGQRRRIRRPRASDE